MPKNSLCLKRAIIKDKRNANYQCKQFLFSLLRQLSCNLPSQLLKLDSCHKHTAELDHKCALLALLYLHLNIVSLPDILGNQHTEYASFKIKKCKGQRSSTMTK